MSDSGQARMTKVCYYVYMWTEKYKEELTYIDNYWEKIIYKPSHLKLKYKLPKLFYSVPYMNTIPSRRGVDNKHIGPTSVKLPYYFFVPNDNKFIYVFYWDSFFMFRGLMGTKRQWLMREMVENFLYLFTRYNVIPNFSAPAAFGRTQPPFLSSMIMDTYENKHSPLHPMHYPKRRWLKRAIAIAKREYELVWIDKQNAYNHHVDGYGLARYGDRDIGYSQSSEIESGWDMTSRFYNRCDHFLPIDLNAYLYKYETDFAHASELLDEKNEAKKWLDKAKRRKDEINKYMWDEKEGFFYDYGYAYNRISSFLSLASFTPLWAGIASYEQAKRAVLKLDTFETEYGLTITAKESLAHKVDLSTIEERYHPAINQIITPKQWDYPNIWAPMEYLTVIGLLRYGFIDDAKRIMTKSVTAHSNAYQRHHTFFEKLNGITGDTGAGALYIDQQGFGWTNAVFYRYIQILDAIENGTQIYKNPDAKAPPYDLAISN